MKKVTFIVITLFITNLSFAQFYVSGSAGYALGSAEHKLGEIITSSNTENSYGSYGEGSNYQLRVGYFFNETFGVDLGFSYLQGADQTVTKVDLPVMQLNADARARAYGFSPSIVYKFTDHLYGRFGALLKLGGKTEAVVYNKTVMSPEQAAGLQLPVGSYTETNYVEDYHGHLPLGFVGAFGYNYNFGNNFSVFAEAEYMGISVKRKDSEIQSFNTDVKLADGTTVVDGFYSIDNLPPGYVIKTEYVDELPNSNTDISKKLSQTVPYSSFGINIGVTYNFGK
ncbi:MAG: outer membrane beta-barrel protein [Bacteroidota bacterium]